MFAAVLFAYPGQAPTATPLKHRVVIELNVPGILAAKTVLSNAKNLKKAFAPDQISIEIVCEGAGLDLVLRESNMAKELRQEHQDGVMFLACGNTIRARNITPKQLLDFVQIVNSGVAEVVRKQEQGWSYLKGAY